MKNIVFFQPALQHDNTGDILINKVLLDILRKNSKLIVDDSNKPSWFLAEIGLTSDEYLSKTSSKSLLQTIRDYLNKGTNQEHIYLVIPPGHTSRKGKNTAIYGDHGFYRTRLLLKLKKKGLRILRFGFSIGPFDWYNVLAESFYSRVFKAYCVRDSKSMELAKKFFFKSPQLMPDLAWAFDPLINPNYNSAHTGREYIVLSFRSNSFGAVHDSQYLIPIINSIKQLVQDPHLRHYDIKVAYQVKFDEEPSIELYNELKKARLEVSLVSEKLDLQSAVDLYAGAKFVVSNRLHVIMLGLSVNTLSLPLVIDRDNTKITSIFNDNDLSSLLLKTNYPEDFKHKLAYIFSNYENLAEKIADTIEKNKKAVFDSINQAFKI